MISPATLRHNVLTLLARAGVDWYACYQKMHTLSHFNRLRKDQSYAARLAVKELAKADGMLADEGLLLGTGELLDAGGNVVTSHSASR